MFDLDDTLAESFKPPKPETIEGLKQLLERIPVAIITGAGLQRMEEQFLPLITASPHADRLYIFPNSSAQLYLYENGLWKEAYSLALTLDERSRIKQAILEVMSENEVLRSVPHYGQQMFDRDAQVAYTIVGFDAPLEIKQTWDADGSKRRTLADALKQKLPDFEILLGGTTTVDITRKGINKSYGVEQFSKRLEIPVSEMLYVGDAFYEGGNDIVVIPTGIPTRSVDGPEETPGIIRELVAARAT